MRRLFVGWHVVAVGIGVSPSLEVLNLFGQLSELRLHRVDDAILLFDVSFEEGLFYLEILDL